MDFNLRQRQTLDMRLRPVITQRLKQALHLLQVPTLELEQILRQELMANPLLEEIEPLDDEEDSREENKEITHDEPPTEDPVDWDEYFRDGFRNTGGEQEHDDEDQIERPTVYVPSGQQALEDQLHMALTDDVDRQIGEYIIGCLNEDGFLIASLAEIAAYFEIEVEKVEEILMTIQQFEPVGVGARDLRECLLIQLAALGLENSDEAQVVAEHFEALKNRKFADIARDMKITTRDVQDIAERIGELDPRPGLSLGGEGARFVIPDLVVDKVDDDFVVFLNDSNLPGLRVSTAYEGQDGNRPGNDDAVKFIDEKKRYAEWIIKTIEQRRRTMIKVMETIVDKQGDFFLHGAIALKPLTLQQVASVIGMHESTVSRVTRQKYVQTPRGVFPLKYFFSAGLDTDGGDEVAAKAVKMMIKDIVAKENTAKPLSDKKIVDILSEGGLQIARRTVAKYRDQLGILAARYRKQF